MLLLITFSYSRLVSCFISFYLRCELNRSEMKHNEQKKANSNDAENERETEIERDREQKHITRMYAKKYERIGNFFLFIYSVLFFVSKQMKISPLSLLFRFVCAFICLSTYWSVCHYFGFRLLCIYVEYFAFCILI